MQSGLVAGLANALSPGNLLACGAGCVLGTLVGVFPGLGPASAVAILFPLAFYLPPAQTLIVLAGIYYGAMYGGSTTSILMNVPGEVSSVPTALDGYQMTRQGRAGSALAMAAIASFLAGTMGILGLNVFGPAIARLALVFGPVECFGLVLFSLTCIAGLSGASLARGLISCAVGMLLALVGPDPLSGIVRLTYNQSWLLSGFEVIPMTVGLFGATEVIISLGEGLGTVAPGRIGRILPSRGEWRPGLLASVRGSISGFLLGLIPGLIPGVTSFLAYDIEKRVAPKPERFGMGAIEGVAAPEAANNATAVAGFIPLMSLGIPTSPTLAMFQAALLTYGVFPGPMLFTQHADLAWTVIGSMYIGNVVLLVLNLPLVGLWARIALVPYRLLGPIILALCFVGSYCIRNSMFDVWSCIVFGAIGYFMRKRNWPIAPLLLGFILGPLLEQSLRQSLDMSGGSLSIFVAHPIFLGFLLFSLVSALLSYLLFKRTRSTAVM